MVCVLQSKLPRSRAVFQFYCAPFFFSPKLGTFYTFYCLRGTSFSLFTSTFAAQIHSFEGLLLFHAHIQEDVILCVYIQPVSRALLSTRERHYFCEARRTKEERRTRRTSSAVGAIPRPLNLSVSVCIGTERALS